MIKTIDTSYYIINNKEKKELFIYYDTKHELDCNMDIFDFQLRFNLNDINNDNKDEIIEQYFKDNWTRFLIVKSIPYKDLISIGISFKQILNMVNEIANTTILYGNYKSI